MNKKVLSIGFGDIAARFTPLFLKDNCEMYAVARSQKSHHKQLQFLQSDISSAAAKSLMTEHSFDAAIITLTPDSYDEEAYKRTYIDHLDYLIQLWQSHRAPKLVVFASSTAVYQQGEGAWVDEQSETKPARYNGELMLAAEQLLAQSHLPHCIVRFSGIYGPGRNYLIRLVKARTQGGQYFSNRIHADDCAATLHFVCQQHWQEKLNHNMILATDCEPARACDVHHWLADEMGIGAEQLTETPNTSARVGNRRCSNRRLLQSGFKFQYPTFREGYKQVLGNLDKDEQANTK